jgi:hypothetical protein
MTFFWHTQSQVINTLHGCDFLAPQRCTRSGSVEGRNGVCSQQQSAMACFSASYHSSAALLPSHTTSLASGGLLARSTLTGWTPTKVIRNCHTGCCTITAWESTIFWTLACPLASSISSPTTGWPAQCQLRPVLERQEWCRDTIHDIVHVDDVDGLRICHGTFQSLGSPAVRRPWPCCSNVLTASRDQRCIYYANQCCICA